MAIGEKEEGEGGGERGREVRRAIGIVLAIFLLHKYYSYCNGISDVNG